MYLQNLTCYDTTFFGNMTNLEELVMGTFSCLLKWGRGCKTHLAGPTRDHKALNSHHLANLPGLKKKKNQEILLAI